MGYDMYWIEVAEDDETDDSYFRLGISGMSATRQEMHRQGMLMTDYERPQYPSGDWSEDFKSWHPKNVAGIAVHKFGSNDGWIVTPEEIRAALAIYEQKLVEPGHAGGEETIDRGGAELVGDKVLEMLGVAAPSLISDVDPGVWGRWIEWLEKAAERGGFEVW